MKIFPAGLAENAWDSPQQLQRFQDVESQLDELRSSPVRKRNRTAGYAKTLQDGRRISSAHVEKQQMRWTRTEAQRLLHVRTALINGTLSHYSGQQCLS